MQSSSLAPLPREKRLVPNFFFSFMFFSFQVQLVQKSSLAQPCEARGCEDRAGQPQGARVSLRTGTQWLHVALWLLRFGDTSLLSLSCHDRTQVPLPAQLQFLSRFLQRCQNDKERQLLPWH